MSDNENFTEDVVDASKNPKLAEKLLDEASRTVSKIPREADVRDQSVLDEEQQRLQRIADSLIRKTTDQE